MKRTQHRLVVTSAGVLLVVVLRGTSLLQAADSQEGIDFFEKKIRPVLLAKCYSCHSAEAGEAEGGLRLDTREGIRRGGDAGPAVVPGNAAESLLLQAIRYQEGLEMPPDERLDRGVIEDFSKWIAMGAPDPREGESYVERGAIDIEQGRKHWAYRPISSPTVPAVKYRSWAKSDIDRFILAGLEAKGLKPVPDAQPLDLLRRISFDLTGLPPTPETVESFESKSRRDRSSAVESLIDELLASPHFGERWGRHWLDLARYAESNGGNHNILVPQAPRYRDYVIDALNADKPYDQFIREQLAGDLLPAGTDAERNEQLIATGFLALGVKDLRERNGHRFRLALAAEQIDVVGRAFLGQTLACAQCHDHKFDPIPTSDYYALAGIFYSSQPRMSMRAYNTPFIHAQQPLAGSGLVGFDDRELRSFRIKANDTGKASRAVRDEGHRLLREAGLLDQRGQHEAFLNDHPRMKELRAELEKRRAELEPLTNRYLETMRQSVAAMRDVEEPKDLHVHIRGEDSLLGDLVPRGFPRVMTNGASPRVNREQSGRLELAEWIASPDNPLTARVAVNRVWQHLFGTGLVETSDNFGTTGQPPGNPALLDHLSRRFIAHGWSVKSLIREIMLSRVYQLGTDHHPTAWEIDPDNRLHWRMNRRRLSSDAIFDSLLFVSGELQLERPAQEFIFIRGVEGGLRMKDFYIYLRGKGNTDEWVQPVENHRTVYHRIFRDHIPHEWSVFDFPDPELLAARREVTTVPTQALYMMNGEFAVERSRQLAKRILASSEGSTDAGAVRSAYLRVLGRPASEQETTEAAEFLDRFVDGKGKTDRDAALAVFCQTLFASAEFRYTY